MKESMDKLTALTNKLYETRLDPSKVIQKQPTLLSVSQRSGTSSIHIPIFSLGDLSLIQGRQKSKKTFFTSSIAVSLLNPNKFDILVSTAPTGTTLAIFDTEQSAYHAQKTNQRIEYMAGSNNFYYFAFRDSTPTERKELIEHFLKGHKGTISYILIDGIVDLLYDFNDLKECSELVQWIMHITKEYNIHCSCILHENASDGKARGHIGTMLAQKAETVLKIEKHGTEHNRSTISANDTRGLQFQSFDIVIDNNGIPELVEMLEKKKVFVV
jgi:hypothetical protein